MTMRNTFALWIIYISLASSGSGETTGGNGNNEPCKFPFLYEGRSYNTCIDINHKVDGQPRLWCATTFSYDDDGLWGECKDEDLANLPTFDQSTPTNVTVYEGDTARLLCTIYNLQGKKVTWQIRGDQQPLTVGEFVFFSNGHYETEKIGQQRNLVINRARRQDSKVYQCRVSTRTMLLVREIHLTVTDRPETSTPAVTLGESSTIYVEKGKELMLQCNATAKEQIRRPNLNISPPEVEWFKDGHKINSHALNQMLITNAVHEDRMRISTLTILRTDMDDAGIYVCRTTDKANAEVAVRILNGWTTPRSMADMPAVDPSQSPRPASLQGEVDRDNRKRDSTSGASQDSIVDIPGNAAILLFLSTPCISVATLFVLIHNLT